MIFLQARGWLNWQALDKPRDKSYFLDALKCALGLWSLLIPGVVPELVG